MKKQIGRLTNHDVCEHGSLVINLGQDSCAKIANFNPSVRKFVFVFFRKFARLLQHHDAFTLGVVVDRYAMNHSS
ncbi:hypothetical protein OFN94_38060, partial [Escherichia coli]|nr:hypothetical protein [Escherichia coli]